MTYMDLDESVRDDVQKGEAYAWTRKDKGMGIVRSEAQSREITEHQTNAANRAITVLADARDENNGNTSHVYKVHVHGNELRVIEIPFQHGPIGEVGVNGLTNEVLLAIVADRLRGFQSSKYSCRENALALTKLEEALHWLEARTRGREARGVEGTHAV